MIASTEKEIAAILLKIKAVVLSPHKPFTFSSGLKSPIYCDNRLLMAYPELRIQVRDAFIRSIGNEKILCDCIGGTATAGIPHAAWIADKLRKPMIYIRSAEKAYGKNKQIEGLLKQGQKVVIIEDLVSTGSSSIKAIEAVRNAGGIVDHCCAIFTYQMKKSDRLFKEAKINLHTLSNFSVLVEEGVKGKYISEKEKQVLIKWNADPDNWKP